MRVGRNQRSLARAAGLFVASVVVGGGAIWAATGRVTWALRFVGIVVLAGLTLFMRALGKSSARVLKHMACSHCSRQVLFEHEAEVCAQCGAGLHARCVDEHRSKTHAAGPFR